MKVLFVCSKNQWRSPTAEALCRQWPEVQARSAGTHNKARVRVGKGLIKWAELICVMEQHHLTRLRQLFGKELSGKQTAVLDIPDHYQRDDPELIARLQDILPTLLILKADR